MMIVSAVYIPVPRGVVNTSVAIIVSVRSEQRNTSHPRATTSPTLRCSVVELVTWIAPLALSIARYGDYYYRGYRSCPGV